jgi:hypothetical protein
MLTYLALTGATLFALLALLHYAWAATGRVPAAVIPTKRDGSPLFEPKRSESAVMGTVLLFAGFLVMQRGGVGPSVLPHWLRIIGTGGIAFMMLMRGIGDRRYMGLLKSEKKTRFGQMDTRLYTPLVLLLALITGLVSYGGI